MGGAGVTQRSWLAESLETVKILLGSVAQFQATSHPRGRQLQEQRPGRHGEELPGIESCHRIGDT